MSDDDIYIYAQGIVCCSVCAPKGMSREVIEAVINAEYPTGINSSWAISEDETFASGQPNPCPCDDHPVDRLHYLLNC